MSQLLTDKIGYSQHMHGKRWRRITTIGGESVSVKWPNISMRIFSTNTNNNTNASYLFDSHRFRIDHILGFFRIWEIPGNAVTGLLGHFNPSIPVWKSELIGIWDLERLYSMLPHPLTSKYIHNYRTLYSLACAATILW